MAMLIEIMTALAYCSAFTSSISFFVSVSTYIDAMLKDIQQMESQLASYRGRIKRSERIEVLSIFIDAIKFHHTIIEYSIKYIYRFLIMIY